MVFKTIEKINNEPDISLNDLPVWFVKALDKLIELKRLKMEETLKEYGFLRL